MGLLEITASIAAAILVGALTRGAWRTYSLLALSVLAVYWFQPSVPLRGFDFWFPSLTLVLVVLVWSLVSEAGEWRSRPNLIALLLIIGLPAIIDLMSSLFPDPLFFRALPPQFIKYVLFVLVSATVTLSFYQLSRRQLWTLSIAIVLLILILLILKSPFLSVQTSVLFRTLQNRSIDLASPTDLRWLGFSYIAFRLIHVLRDKQLRRLPALSLAEFGTYVIFFPSLAAGPIDRAERFAQDLHKEFKLTQDEMLSAGQRLVLGLFKKFVIADALALIALNDTLATQVRFTGWMWIVLYAYAFQIYFDFSGYTDIAIGIARLAGIKLPENFASPYTKPNLTQFWNSWHLTLTQWIRSYFFNPFNRWIRGYRSIPAWTMILLGQAATMLLIGLWHGVTVNFIFWGLWHGLGLFLQNRWSDFANTRLITDNARLKSALQLGGVLLTFHFVALGWVFFALSSPSLSWMVFRRLFNLL